MTDLITRPVNSSDIIFIEALEVSALIGVYDWERKQKQALIIDVEMAKDIAQAALSDDLSYTLNYAEIANRLISFIDDSSFELLESLAEACVSLLVKQFAVTWIRLKISKPGAIKEAACAGILIERQVTADGSC